MPLSHASDKWWTENRKFMSKAFYFLELEGQRLQLIEKVDKLRPQSQEQYTLKPPPYQF